MCFAWKTDTRLTLKGKCERCTRRDTKTFVFKVIWNNAIGRGRPCTCSDSSLYGDLRRWRSNTNRVYSLSGLLWYIHFCELGSFRSFWGASNRILLNQMLMVHVPIVVKVLFRDNVSTSTECCSHPNTRLRHRCPSSTVHKGGFYRELDKCKNKGHEN